MIEYVYTEFGYFSEKRVSPGPPVSVDLGLGREPPLMRKGVAQVARVAEQRQVRVTVAHSETDPVRFAIGTPLKSKLLHRGVNFRFLEQWHTLAIERCVTGPL